MSEFLETLYLRCREQHDSAVRWSAVMVGIVLVLHFTVLTEMVRLKRDLAANKRALAQSARAVEASERLAGPLEAFDHSTVGFSSNLLQRFVADLKSDFRRLSAAVDLAMQDAPKPGTPVPPEGLSLRPFHPASQFTPPAAAPNVALTPNSPGIFPVDLPLPLNEADQRSIQEARHQPERLRGIVLPIIQQRILEPAFFELNRRWDDNLSNIRAEAERLEQAAQRFAADFPETNTVAAAQAIRADIRQAADKAAQHRFKAPENDAWWRSVPGKDQFGLFQAEQVAGQLAGAARAQRIGVELRTQLASAHARQEQLDHELEQRFEALKKELEEAQSQLGTMAKPLQFVALDVDLMLSRLPLLIAVVLAGALAWTGYQARKLREAATTLTAATSAAPASVLGPGAGTRRANAWLALLAMLWVGAAAYTAWRAEAPRGMVVSSTVAAVILTTAALGYRARSC